MADEIERINDNNEIVAGFQTMQGFELLQRQGKMLSQCSMLPDNFKNNIPDCAIALEMSARMGYAVSPLLILQSIVSIHGKPTFEAKFVIGPLKEPLRIPPLLIMKCLARSETREKCGERRESGATASLFWIKTATQFSTTKSFAMGGHALHTRLTETELELTEFQSRWQWQRLKGGMIRAEVSGRRCQN